VKKTPTTFLAARPALALLGLLALGSVKPAFGQAELAPWGNLTGLRVQGQLLETTTSLRLVRPGAASEVITRHEAQRPRYTRQGAAQLVTTRLDSVDLRETVTDLGPGRATVAVLATAQAATPLLGTFLALDLPAGQYAQAQVQFLDAQGKVLAQQALSGAPGESPVASRLRIVAAARQLDITLATPGKVLLRPSKPGQPLLVYLPIQTGNLAKGQTAQQTFTIAVHGHRGPRPGTAGAGCHAAGPAVGGLWGQLSAAKPQGRPAGD
jgi:hypothetical protein